MKINCLCCGHKVDLDDAYDDYEGQVKCFACGAILEIKTEQGGVKHVRLLDSGRRASTFEARP
jgi:transcription initiation factor IIE alpha subunit